MMGKYQELRDALSQNPTPGPWSAYISGNTMQVDSTPQASGGRPCVVFWPGFDGNDLSVRANAKNTRYIAAANPEAIRALLAERDQYARILAGLPQDAIDGGWTAKGISAHAKALEAERDALIHDNAEYVEAACALATENERLRSACEKAVEWLEGWASAEPYLTELRAALTQQEQGK